MIEEAIQAVVEAIQDAALTRSDGQTLTVNDFDPRTDSLDRPEAVSVTFTLMNDTEIGVTVRLYCDTSSDIRAAEVSSRLLCPLIDRALDVVPAPRSRWAKTFAEQLAAYVIETTLEFPRDDF